MIDPSTIPDGHVRRLAETTFDRNVVVVAGAGTGKTTLLVNRLLNALIRDPAPIPITKIVALTFTNKAATELKLRLQEQLLSFVEWDSQEKNRVIGGSITIEDFQKRYRLSVGQIVSRAKRALDDIEKAQIGTLHSFAAHLLRLYPLESGVQPNFHEDDGARFKDHFAHEWEIWIDHELGLQGKQHEQWQTLLTRLSLDHIREFAFNLCLDVPDLKGLLQDVAMEDVPANLRDWLMTKRNRAVDLLATVESAKIRKVEKALSLAQKVFDHHISYGLEGGNTCLGDEKKGLFSNLGKMPNGWTEPHFAEARTLIRIAQSLFSVQHDFLLVLLTILTSFAEKVRESFVNEGWITFQDLLIRARSLLRDYPVVRECLKQEYRALLIDEFQDTDPIQYEIVLYLCEVQNVSAVDWKDVQLMSGKLFIVGDPKQSIYAFRGADLEAFDRVVRKIQDSGGVVYELSTNFRSHHAVLDVVNEVFNRLFHPQKHIQPNNIPLVVQPDREGRLKHPGVEMRLVNVDDAEQDLDSSTITRLEAEHLAWWIKEELLTHEMLKDSTGHSVPIQPGHIGLLFRKLTQAQIYLEALRRCGIPYVTDGEKHFYRRQEVIDLVNVLRVVENPRDEVAMLGVLRSSLGGLNDREIYEIGRLEVFDYRERKRLNTWKSSKVKELKRLYELLADLHEQAFQCPFVEIMDLIFSRLPVLELAAASSYGEQAVANLMKVRVIASEMDERPHMSFTGLVNLLVNRLDQQPSEAERALVEESLDAVRVLTIHKAKGLEFPIVILPGFHHGAQTGYEGASSISRDWATGMMGISIGQSSNLGAVLTKEKKRVKEEAEQRRLLYVAMTRAQERLIISGGCPKRPVKGTFLSFLQSVTASKIEDSHCETITVGSVTIPKTVTNSVGLISESVERGGRTLTRPQDLSSWLNRWGIREKNWVESNAMPTYLNPTSQSHSLHQAREFQGTNGYTEGSRALIGILTHRVLETWDFLHNVDQLRGRVEEVCEYGIPSEQLQKRTAIFEEVYEILQVFLTSSIYPMLQRAIIVGREVPFTISWDCVPKTGQAIKGSSRVMEGVIDLVYQVDEQWWIADYKTDHVLEKEIPSKATYYQEQTNIYKNAARRCLGLQEVKCHLIFLRLGKAVQV